MEARDQPKTANNWPTRRGCAGLSSEAARRDRARASCRAIEWTLLTFCEMCSRYALGARRTALRAEGAARLCAGPPGRRSVPLAAIAASRYALGADGVGAARPGAYTAARSRPRAARSAPKA